jgi:hypothetical protein
MPNAALSAVGDTLRENGLPPPATGSATFLQAKTANEVLKSQERRLKLQKLKGELVDRARAEALNAAELSASSSNAVGPEINLEPATMQNVRARLDGLGQRDRLGLG